jgi:hypothetical protein
MSQTARLIAVKQQYPDIEKYGNGAVEARKSKQGHVDFAADHFGQYQVDSEAKERLRTFYDTLDSVQAASKGEAGSVARMAPISDAEIATVAEIKEVEKQKAWENYWATQCNPAQPWTMTEVAKIAPEVMENKMNAIKSIAQYSLDTNIIRHMGHGGDPRLAHLQYLIDQGEMSHMPQLMKIERSLFKAGPFSIWTVSGGDFDPSAQIKLYRSAAAFGGDGTGGLPTGLKSGRKQVFTGGRKQEA